MEEESPVIYGLEFQVVWLSVSNYSKLDKSKTKSKTKNSLYCNLVDEDTGRTFLRNPRMKIQTEKVFGILISTRLNVL